MPTNRQCFHAYDLAEINLVTFGSAAVVDVDHTGSKFQSILKGKGKTGLALSFINAECKLDHKGTWSGDIVPSMDHTIVKYFNLMIAAAHIHNDGRLWSSEGVKKIVKDNPDFKELENQRLFPAGICVSLMLKSQSRGDHQQIEARSIDPVGGLRTLGHRSRTLHSKEEYRERIVKLLKGLPPPQGTILARVRSSIIAFFSE